MRRIIDFCSFFITFSATTMAAFIMYLLVNMPVAQAGIGI